MASTDARPIPKKNVAYRVTFPIIDVSGNLVAGATGLDSEVSLDGGTFADCTNEATQIATSSGMYYLELTSAEMNADTVAIIVKSTEGSTVPIVMYPVEADDIPVAVTHWVATAVATPSVAGVPEVDVTHYAGVTTDVSTIPASVAAILVDTGTDLPASISGIGTSGGAAISVDANTSNAGGGITGVTSGTTIVGTQTNTYTATSFVNGVYHIMTHATNVLDIVYQFLTGGGTSPVSMRWTGYATNADVFTFSAWNHVGGAWEAIGLFTGTGGTTNAVANLVLLARHRGTSVAELGKVYIRINSTSTGSVINTDQILVDYAVTSRTAGYANGAVWLDTVAGVGGTEVFVNGTADNPASTLANALTIAAAVGLRSIRVVNGSSITLASTLSNYNFEGSNWTLALGGQAVSGCDFTGATVSGTCTGTSPHFHECDFGNVTLPPCYIHSSGFGTTITVGSAGTFVFDQCYSIVAGDATANSPIIDFVGAVGATFINVRHYAGGLELQNMAASDRATVAGTGLVVLNANCSGGTVAIRGTIGLTDNSGNVTLIQEARIAVDTIGSGVWGADATSYQTQGTFGQAIGDPVADTNTIFKAVVTDASGVTVGADVVAVQASVNTIDDFLDTEVAAILADTNELQVDWTNGGRLDLILDIIAADTTTDIPALINDLPTNAELATALGTADDAILAVLGTPAGASVSVDIAAVKVDTAAILVDTGTTLDARIPAALVGGRMDSSVGAMAADTLTASALATDAITEIWAKAMSDLAAVPGATASVLTAINWLFELARNKITQTATTQTLLKDDGSTPLATAAITDDSTTTTRAEWV